MDNTERTVTEITDICEIRAEGTEEFTPKVNSGYWDWQDRTPQEQSCIIPKTEGNPASYSSCSC